MGPHGIYSTFKPDEAPAAHVRHARRKSRLARLHRREGHPAVHRPGRSLAPPSSWSAGNPKHRIDAIFKDPTGCTIAIFRQSKRNSGNIPL